MIRSLAKAIGCLCVGIFPRLMEHAEYGPLATVVLFFAIVGVSLVVIDLDKED